MAGSLKRTTVYILDDHQLIREGLSSLILQDKDFTVIGSSDSCSTALFDIAKQTPDIMIVDITLKDGNGIDFIKTISARYPSVRSLVLSMHDENSYAERAISAGAVGYVMKQEASDLIIAALRCVKDGDLYLSEKMKSKLLSRFVGGKKKTRSLTPESVLSDREFEIFSLIGEGKTAREIADDLGLSIKTVEAHKEHIREKMEINSSNKLVVEAVTWKLTHKA